MSDQIKGETLVSDKRQAMNENTDIPQEDRTGQDKLPALQDIDLVWQALTPVPFDERHLTRNHVVSAERKDPAHVSFDMLRTRLLLAMRENGWTRVAISSPTSGCGKTFVAANLAVALARRSSCRTVLMDMDLRNPSLSDVMGVNSPEAMESYLKGHVSPEDFLVRVGDNLALGLADKSVENPAELMQEVMTGDVIDEISDLFCPEMMIFDIPAILEHDDLMAFLPNVDGVIFVVGGGKSCADDVLQAERSLAGIKPLLGVILNRAEGVITY